ncbi:ML domain-containing protein [Kitasatospora sp. NPDC058162]|uniref:ML domain-containing protein n=1 Tax=Kitasatospora sp. NPDC058162 TaxID=3346362 RepID=UPI0036DD3993
MVESVAYTPKQVVKGSTLTVTLTGTLNKAITSGTVDLLLTYGLTTTAEQTTPLTAAAAGPYTAQTTCPVSTDTPSGSYIVRVTVLDQDNTVIACITFSLQIV